MFSGQVQVPCPQLPRKTCDPKQVCSCRRRLVQASALLRRSFSFSAATDVRLDLHIQKETNEGWLDGWMQQAKSVVINVGGTLNALCDITINCLAELHFLARASQVTLQNVHIFVRKCE